MNDLIKYESIMAQSLYIRNRILFLSLKYPVYNITKENIEDIQIKQKRTFVLLLRPTLKGKLITRIW